MFVAQRRGGAERAFFVRVSASLREKLSRLIPESCCLKPAPKMTRLTCVIHLAESVDLPFRENERGLL